MSKKDTIKYTGKHAVMSAIENSEEKNIIKIISSDKKFLDNLKVNIKKQYMTNSEIDKIAPGIKHGGYIMEKLAKQEISLEQFIKSINKDQITIAALDQVTDPHNIGAIIRSAVAFGVDAILVTSDNSPQNSAVISKTSAGGIEKIDIIRVTNLSRSLEKLKEHGFWIIGLDCDTKDDICDMEKIDKLVIILGSEGSGMRRLTKESCDFLYKIPMSDNMQSLNVSNAAAIAFYETFKLKSF